MHKQPFDHDRDFYGWAIRSAEHLRAGRVAEVDLAHVAEELEDIGKAERHALASHLKVLDELLARRYPAARRRAALETGLALTIFPEEPPYTVEQLLDPDFLD